MQLPGFFRIQTLLHVNFVIHFVGFVIFFVIGMRFGNMKTTKQLKTNKNENGKQSSKS